MLHKICKVIEEIESKARVIFWGYKPAYVLRLDSISLAVFCVFETMNLRKSPQSVNNIIVAPKYFCTNKNDPDLRIPTNFNAKAAAAKGLIFE